MIRPANRVTMTKDHILSEIRRTATSNGGVPLGLSRFFGETGIKSSDWDGRYWARWSDVVKEAGFEPNQLNAARTDEDLLNNLAGLVRELGRFPVMSEIKLKARSDPGFPSHNTFRRFGGKQALAAKLQRFCNDRVKMISRNSVSLPLSRTSKPKPRREVLRRLTVLNQATSI